MEEMEGGGRKDHGMEGRNGMEGMEMGNKYGKDFAKLYGTRCSCVPTGLRSFPERESACGSESYQEYNFKWE